MNVLKKRYRITTNGLYFRVERRRWLRWRPVTWYETCGNNKNARVAGYRGEIEHVYNTLVEVPKDWRPLTPEEMKGYYL